MRQNTPEIPLSLSIEENNLKALAKALSRNTPIGMSREACLDFSCKYLFGKNWQAVLADFKNKPTITKSVLNASDFVTINPIDNTLNCVWECAPLDYFNQADITLLIELCKTSFPEGNVVQFTSYASDKIKHLTNVYYPNLPDYINPVLKSFATSQRDFINKDSDNLFNYAPTRNFRLFVTMKTPYTVENKEDHLALFVVFFELLQKCGLKPKHIDISGQEELFRDVCSVNGGEKIVSRENYIQKMLIKGNFSKIHNANKQNYYRCLTIKDFDKNNGVKRDNDILSEVWGIGSNYNQIKTPYIYTLNIINRLEKDNAIIDVLPVLWTWTKDSENADKAIHNIRRVLEMNGHLCREEKTHLTELLAIVFPLGYPKTDSDNKFLASRNIKIDTSSLANILPIQGDFRGGGKNIGIPFTGRRGQVGHIDFFGGNHANNNCVVTGSTGTGVSFFVNMVSASCLIDNVKIRIVDIGEDFKHICTTIDGQYTHLDPFKPISLNPFTTVKDIGNDFPPIKELIVKMLLCNNFKYLQLQDVKKIVDMVIDIALDSVWKDKNIEADMDSLYACFKAMSSNDYIINEGYKDKHFSSVAEKLYTAIEKFTSNGIYGNWFKGPCEIEFKKQLSVIDLEYLKRDPVLFKVIGLRVVDEINRWDYPDDIKKLTIISEAWQILSDDDQPDCFLITLKNRLETGKSINHSMFFCTQSILDFTRFGEIGDIILKNTDFRFYFPMGHIDRVQEILKYDPFVVKLIKSINNNIPNYSECMIVSPYGYGPARFRICPFGKAMIGNIYEYHAKLKSHIEKGLSCLDALNKIANIDKTP